MFSRFHNKYKQANFIWQCYMLHICTHACKLGIKLVAIASYCIAIAPAMHNSDQGILCHHLVATSHPTTALCHSSVQTQL